MESKYMKQISLQIPKEVTVMDLEGNEVVLQSLWKDKYVVLAFLRHFG